MRRFLSLASGVAFLGLLALATFVYNPAGLPHNPPSQKNAFQPTWAEIFTRKEQLKQLEEGLNRYWEVKRQVAKEVIAGRRSLTEAIEEFRNLDEQWLSASHEEQILKELRMSELEWRGREVIYFARRVLADRPDEEAAVADRLEKELQSLVANRKKRHSALPDSRTEWGR
jgi:hypothetical protein